MDTFMHLILDGNFFSAPQLVRVVQTINSAPFQGSAASQLLGSRATSGAVGGRRSARGI